MDIPAADKGFEYVKTEVLHIIDQHLGLEDLLKEIQDKGGPHHSDKNETLLRSSIHNYVELYSTTLGVRQEQALQNIFSQHLNQLSLSFQVQLDEAQNEFFTKLLESAKKFLDPRKILMGLKDMKHFLPLGVFLELLNQGIITLQEVLKRLVENGTALKDIMAGLQELSMSNDNNQIKLAADILTYLVCVTCNSENSKAVEKVSHYILHKVFTEIISKQMTMKPHENPNMTKTKTKCVFERLRDGAPSEELRKCFSQQLVLWLTSDCTFKASDAVNQQLNWSSCKLSIAVITSYEHIIKAIGPDETVTLLHKTVAKREVNWKRFLTVVSSLLLTFPHLNFDGMIRHELCAGFESSSLEHLIVGLLFARQCSSEGAHLFPSYTEWFQRTFAGSDGMAGHSPPGFRFLIKLLTDLVPYEPAQFLRVHVLRPPHPPNATCREILSEYLSLSRARLLELKPAASCTPSDQAETQVNELVETFRKTNKVPPKIQEISIFHSHYFNSQFLPALLRPRPLPDLKDAKMKLIASLVSVGKISKAMYEKYESSCKEEMVSLVQDAMEIDDEDETFDESLSRLQRELSNYLEKSLASDESQLQNLHRHLSGLLQTETSFAICDVTSSDCVVVTKESILAPETTKVAECIVTSLSSNADLVLNDAGKLERLVAVVGNHLALKQALCNRSMALRKESLSNQRGLIIFILGTLTSSDWSIAYLPSQSASTVYNLETRFCAPKEATREVSHLAFAAFRNLFDPSNFFDSTTSLNFYLRALLSMREIPEFENRTGLFTDLYRDIFFAETRLAARGSETDNGPLTKRQKQNAAAVSPLDVSQLLAESRDQRKRLEELLKIEKRDKMPITGFAVRELQFAPNEDFLNESQRSCLYSEVFYSCPVTSSELSDVMHLMLNGWRTFCASGKLTNPFCQFICSELSTLVGALEADVSPSDWLIEFLLSRRNQIKESFGEKPLVSDNLCNMMATESGQLLLRLPCNFLYSRISYDSDAYSVDKLRPLLNFVGTFFRHSFWGEISQGDPRNSSMLTSHLVTGLLECHGDPSWPQLTQLFTQVPALFMSLLLYWSSMPRLRFLSKTRWSDFHQTISCLNEFGSLASSSGTTEKLKQLLSGSSTLLGVVCSCFVVTILIGDGKSEMNAKILEEIRLLHNKVTWFLLRAIFNISAQFMSRDGSLDGAVELLSAALWNVCTGEVVACVDSNNDQLSQLYPCVEIEPAVIKLFSKSKLPENLMNHVAFLPALIRLYNVSHTKVDNDWIEFLPRICGKAPRASLKSALQSSFQPHLESESRHSHEEHSEDGSLPEIEMTSHVLMTSFSVVGRPHVPSVGQYRTEAKLYAELYGTVKAFSRGHEFDAHSSENMFSA